MLTHEDLEAIKRLLEDKISKRAPQPNGADMSNVTSQLEAKFSIIQDSFQRLESIMLKILQN